MKVKMAQQEVGFQPASEIFNGSLCLSEGGKIYWRIASSQFLMLESGYLYSLTDLARTQMRQLPRGSQVILTSEV